GTLEDPGDGRRQGAPGARFLLELLAAGTGQLVVLGPAVVFGGTPVGLHPAASLQAVEGRIEGSLLHLERFGRDLLDARGHVPTVAGSPGEGPPDPQVEGSLGRRQDVFAHGPPPFDSARN